MKLEKKYGLFTAICMVVGIVIGSGVFFKAQAILNATGGNMTLGIIAWIIGGVIMIVCASTFAVMATKYEKVNGVVDYAEVTVGNGYAFHVGWFLSTIYYPTLTSVLAWLTARYFGELFGWQLQSAEVMTLGALFLIGSFALNSLAPKVAGKLQVSTTIIKLIPLILMAIVGTIYGLCTTVNSYVVVDGKVVKEGTTQMQILIENFKNIGDSGISILFAAVVATAFAYEGWVVATSINAELKNSKKNLPLALFFGSIVIVVVYVLYYIGVAGGATIEVLQTGGAPYAFLQIFGDFFGTILKVFIAISCLGTLNGLMLGCTRGLYAIASRDLLPHSKTLKVVDQETNMPVNSSVLGLLLCGIWYAYFYLANLADPEVASLGFFAFDSSELPIITTYAFYIPIFIMMIVKERKELGVFKGLILPILSVICCIFMCFAAIYAHGITPYLNAAKEGVFKCPIIAYLIFFIIIMVSGTILYVVSNRKSDKEKGKLMSEY